MSRGVGGPQILQEPLQKRRDELQKEEILEKIGNVRKISEDESCKLEERITMEEVSKTLRSTKNNVAPGAKGFSGSFYKVFWCLIKLLCLGQFMK